MSRQTAHGKKRKQRPDSWLIGATDSPSTVESLLRYGADPTALTNAGETACRLANEWLRQSEILAMLCPKI